MNAAAQLTILQSAVGEKITLTRGGLTVPMVAIRGRSTANVVGMDGSQTEFNLTDWLMTIWQPGELNKPQRNDVITVVSTGATYTVAHPDPTGRCVVWHGNDETAYRVHTLAEGQ